MGLLDYMEAVKRYTHDITEDGDATLCGINWSNGADTLPIGCNCGHEACKHPITCPVCQQVATGRKAN